MQNFTAVMNYLLKKKGPSGLTILLLILALMSGVFVQNAKAVVPTITSFTPSNGPVGTLVTITGTNFTGASAVSFGGTAAASFIVVSSTSITAVVSTGTSGSVSVTAPGGSVASSGTFTFLTPPPPGNALSYNGTNQYVTVPDASALDLTNNFTVEAWIKPESFSASKGIVSKFNSAGANGFSLTLGATAPYSSISFCGQTTANGVLTAGKWYHVAGVVDAGIVTIYIDGMPVKTGTATTLAANADAMTIGRASATPVYFAGTIDEVRIWNDIRTQVELATNIFTELTPSAEANLVAYYNCNEGTGSTLNDSKNGYNGTLTNAPSWVFSYAWMGGIYTVNPSGTGHDNFTTFALSVTTVNAAKISSSVIFKVKDDKTFTETAPQILTVAGTGAKNITWQRSNDGSNKPKLKFTGTAASTDACIQLDHCDWMTFNGLEIQPNGTSSSNFVEYGIYLNGTGVSDGCQRNTIQNCDIKFGGGGTTNTALTIGILLDNSATTSSGANSYNDFLKINIDKATRGYQFIGTSGYPDIQNNINTNSSLPSISDIGYGGNAAATYGIDYQYQTSLTIAYQVISFRSAAITSATGCVAGIHSSGGNLVSKAVIHHNTLQGLTVNKSDASLRVRLILLEDNLSASIYNNNIQTVDNQNTNSDGVWGICINQGASTIYNNTITGLKNNSTATNAGRVVGIETSGTTTRIYNNKIYDLRYVNSANTSLANVIGIFGWISTSDTIYNNMIYQLYAPAVNGRAVSGIELSASTVNASVLFNTIYIDGTSTNSFNSSACIYKANTGSLDLRNNIMINKMAGGNNAMIYRWMTAENPPSMSTTANNNLYYVGTGSTNNWIFYNGTTSCSTLASYKALWTSSPKREQTSVTEANTPFMSTSGTYNLHINPALTTLAAGAGSPISSIPSDIDNVTRSSTNPDLGADEFYQPALVVNPASLAFDPINSGSISASQIFTLRGSDLTENVTITAPAHFQISFDDITYTTTTLTKSITNGATGTTYLYVKFAPTSTGAKSGDVSFTANSITTNVEVTGLALDPSCTGPSTAASNLTFKNITNNSIQVAGLTAATGASGYVVYVNKTNSFTAPSNGSIPAVYTAWANSGQQAIYMGDNPSNAIVTGLTATTTWYFKVYAYKLCNGGNYYESTGLGASVSTIGGPIYVKYNASGSNNGTSWTNAYKSLQSALDATSAGTQIWVAKGTYYPSKDNTGSATPTNARLKTFYINKKVFIYGGFAGTESNITQRTNFGHYQTNETILSGNIGALGVLSDNCYNVVSITGKAGDVSIDGFTIQDGFANEYKIPNVSEMGAGLNFDAGSYYAYGSSNPAISNCYFRNNTATANGGTAIYIHTAGTGIVTGGSFTNCTIEGNKGGSALLATTFVGGQVQTNFINIKVIGNTGGGICLQSGSSSLDIISSKFINCLISGNISVSTPVVNLWSGGTSQFINCLITANSTSYGCAGLKIGQGEPYIKNTIIWNNSNASTPGGKFTNMTNDSWAGFYKSIVQNWYLGTGNLNPTTAQSANANYPMFTTNIDMVTATLPTIDGDFRLMDNSPVINYGNPDYLNLPPTQFTDLDGEARIQNGGLDLGPYEGGLPCTAPVITVQPVSANKFEGQSVTFDCGATGTGLTYQWRKNGITIIDATSASYTKTELIASDAGSYSCKVTGTCGSVTSNGAMLTIDAGCLNPAITTQPSGASKKLYESVTFSVVATGTNLVYQWKKGGTNISGANNASYTISNLAFTDAGTYTCYISNTCNNLTSSGAVLTVSKADQTITFNAFGSAAYGDADITPDATASSILPVSFASSNTSVATIVSNKVHIVGVGSSTITASQAGDANYNAAPIATQLLTVGKGAATVTLSNLLQAHDGNPKTVTVTTVPAALTVGVTYNVSGTAPSAIGSYPVVATVNETLYQGSATGTLQITCTPVMADPLQSDFYILEEQAFTVTSTAVGTAPLSYQWKKGGTDISGANSAAYTIPSVSTADVGLYTCYISNSCGNVTTNAATLNVKLAQPTSETATPASISRGSSSNLNAVSAGNQIEWYNAPFEGIVLGTVNSGADFSVSPTQTTTYYAGAYNSGPNIYASETRAAVTVTVSTATQTITFGPLTDKTYGDPAFTLTGTASSGLPVSYTSSNMAVATVSGTTTTIVGAGTCNITASQAGNGMYGPAADVVQPLTVNKKAQVISFSALGAKTCGDPQFTLSATGGNSGNPVVFTSSNPAVATCSGANGETVTIGIAGTCTITASQAGNSNYLAATQVGQPFLVSQASQTITFGALATKSYGDPAFTLTGTASSGLPVSYASSDPTVASCGGTNSATVMIVHAGTATITASQAGDARYSAAADVTQTITVNKASQLLSMDLPTTQALSYFTGGNALTITTASTSGLTVELAISGGTTSATLTYVSPGVYSLSNVASSGTIIFTASQSGTTDYNPATLGKTLVVSINNQVISFGPLTPNTYGDVPFALTASSTSSLTVTFSSSNSAVASCGGANNATVTITGAGTAIITASQEGNGTYNPAQDVFQTLTVSQATPTITFADISKTYGEAAFSLSASSASSGAYTYSSGNTAVVTISGSTATIAGAGTTTITATQAADNNYTAASKTATLTVSKANQTITLNSFTSPITVAAFEASPIQVVATSASGGTVTITTEGVAILNQYNQLITTLQAGTVSVTANQEGDGNYHAAPTLSGSFTVNKENQTITFGALENKSVSDPPFSLTATSSSSLAVSYTSSNLNVAAVSGSEVTLVGNSGTTTITASQAGNNYYNAAEDVAQLLTVNTCTNPSGGGTIATAQEICSGNAPSAFTSILAPSGYFGTLEYKWQSSTTSSSSDFIDISSSNSETYTPGTLTQTTWFRRIARVDCADWSGAATSNVLEVTVNPSPTLTGASQEAAICEGIGATINLTGLRANSTFTVNYKINAVAQDPLTDVVSDGSGAASFTSATLSSANNGQTLQITGLTLTSPATYCTATFTQDVVLAVNPYLQVSVTLAASSNPVCSETSVTFTATPTNGGASPVYQWQVNNVNVGSDNATYAYVPANADLISVIMSSSGSCISGNPATSPDVNMTVDPVSAGGSVSGSATVCSGSNSNALTLDGNTGSIVKWQYSTNDWTSSTDVANTTTTLTTTNLTVTTKYRAVVQSGVCSATNSSDATVTVNPVSAGGSVSGSATVCSGSNSNALTLDGNTGSIVKWQYSTNDWTSSTDVANTTTTLTTTNLTVTTKYRAVVQSGVCSATNSSDATVTVNPVSAGGSVSGSATVCSGSNSNALTLDGNTGSIVKWQYSTNDWTSSTDVANTTTTLTTTNLTVTTKYRAVVQSGVCSATNSSDATVTVNPVSAGGSVSGSATVCSGSNSNALTLDGNTGSIVKWQYSTNDWTSSTDVANTTTTLTTTNLTVTTKYRAVVQSGVCSSANSSDATVTVDPVSVGGSISGSATVCSGTNSNLLTLSGHTGSILKWQYSTDNWETTVDVANTTTTLTTTNLTVTTKYRAVVQSGVCSTVNSSEATVNVNPNGQVSQPSDQVVCNSAGTNVVTFVTTNIGGTTTFAWTNTTPSIGLAASGSGNIASFTAINTGSSPVMATIMVTPTFNNGGVNCTGPAKSLTITVNPTAQIDQPASQVVCNEATTNTVTFTTTGTGGTTTYTWTNITPSIGLAASGSGNIASFTAINTGSSPVMATIMVTPTFNNGGVNCTGPAKSLTITVNPTAQVDQSASQVVCNAAGTNAVIFTSTGSGGTVSYAWTNDTPSIGLAASGNGNIASFTAVNTGTSPVVATIVVTPTFNNGGVNCTGPAKSFTFTVNPTAQVDQPASQLLCNTSATTAVSFGTVTSGGTTTYTWTNDIPSIGLAASGSGNIASFTAVNTGTSPVVATIVVTPTFSNGGVNCTGPTKSFTITVNPTAQVDQPASQVLCNTAATTTVSFGTVNTGGTTTYAWTNTTPSIGLAASGSGNIASFTAVNTGTSPVVATIVVTPTFNNGGVNCTGTTKSFTITVNPTAQVDQPGSEVLCNTASTTTVSFATVNSGGTTTYTWTNNTPSIGLAASGSGHIASFTALNSGTSPVVATIVVTPTFTGGGVNCTGQTKSFTITVNPTGQVNTINDQVLCNASSTTAVSFGTGNSGGTTTYAWTNTTPSIGLAASGTGNIASFTAINTGTAPVVATIVVTPSFINGGTSCTGPTKSFTITVNPSGQVIHPESQAVCHGQATAAVVFETLNSGGTTTYTWTNDIPSIGLVSSGTGNIASFIAANTNSGPVVATITVTPTFSNGGVTCSGDAKSFKITVNPLILVNQPSNQVVCNTAATTAVIFETTNTGGISTYAWTNDTPSIGLAASGTGDIASFTAVNTSASPVVATIVVTPTFTNAGISCTGAAKSFTITVNPTAQVDQLLGQVVCNAGSTNAVTFTTTGSGGTTTYTWTNDTPSIGLAASGTGNIASFMATNTGTTPITATIVVTPTFTGAGISCTGPTKSFTITVNPTAQVDQPLDQVLCHTAITDPVTFWTANTGGTTTYTWTNDTPSIGLAASGTGSIASFTATNPGTTPVIATIVVSPTFTNNGVSCTGPTKSFTITVNPMPVPTIAGLTSICVNSGYFIYTTEPGMTNYNWTISSGGSFYWGLGTNELWVTWNTPGAQWVGVTYTNQSSCAAQSATLLNITINPMPGPAGNITGATEFCAGTQGVVYFTTPIQDALVYIWNLPTGATIVSGDSTTSIVVDFALNAISGNIMVNGNNLCGHGDTTSLPVTVNPIPLAPVVTASGDTLSSTAQQGNQWYYSPTQGGSGSAIPGATDTIYLATLTGWYWSQVTLNSCGSDTSNHLYVLITGMEEIGGAQFNLYPVPNEGRFTLSITSPVPNTFDEYIFNTLGQMIYERKDVRVSGRSEQQIDLRPTPPGVYTVLITTNGQKIVRRIIIKE